MHRERKNKKKKINEMTKTWIGWKNGKWGKDHKTKKDKEEKCLQMEWSKKKWIRKRLQWNERGIKEKQRM